MGFSFQAQDLLELLVVFYLRIKSKKRKLVWRCVEENNRDLGTFDEKCFILRLQTSVSFETLKETFVRSFHLIRY